MGSPLTVLPHSGRDASEPQGSSEVPEPWREDARATIRTLAELERVLRLSDEERAGIEACARAGLPLAITPHYLSLCDPHDPSCPIRRQCVPSSREQHVAKGELLDPLGEETYTVAPHLVSRYPDRALLLVTDRCALYCRFCTRSRLVGQGSGAVRLQELEPAFAWLDAHQEVRELIVSGGEPLLMSESRLDALFAALAERPHLDDVRVASRLPVTLPSRITPALCRSLRRLPSLWLMTHFNHPKEICSASARACAQLVDAGIPILNHTVLMQGINDDPDTLTALFRGLVRMRVKPYYLLQGDVIVGSSHFRTPLEHGLQLMETLQGRLSGIALPKFVVDTPGGAGKVPLEPRYLERSESGQHTLRTFRGERVTYPDP